MQVTLTINKSEMAGFKSMNLLTLGQWHAQKTGCTASIVILTDKAGVHKEAKLPSGISSSITTGCLLSQPMAAAALADSLVTGSHKLITKTEREKKREKKQQQKPYWWHHNLQSNSHIPSTHLVSPVPDTENTWQARKMFFHTCTYHLNYAILPASPILLLGLKHQVIY